EPEDPGYVSWHQDATYWGLDQPDVCTAWIALTPSTRANGCMRVASGSHGKQLTHTDTFHKDNLLSRGQEINAEVDEKNAVDLELSPGQMSLHHVRIIHGSNPNPTTTRRVGFAIRYIAATVRQSLGPQDFATLVRGNAVNDFWELEPRPKDELDAEALAYHEHMCDVQAKMLFAGAENAKPFQARSER
ncbi:MAG TPA: phytanoyl-CoA dioxygenase, partial [Gammaproteobacteria bacterium]|nr:phytanoyl-CoA dioxygenase [Gammaproteobacteria bacterium]